MLTSIFILFLGLVLLYYGAEWLIKGAAALALALGMSPLLVGLTVVAYGTSAPELIVSLKAAFSGNGGIAVGNIVGSNIANIGLVLGIAALIKPLKVQLEIIKVHVPLMIGFSLLACWMLSDEVVSRYEGGVLFSLLIAYTVLSTRLSKKEDRSEIMDEFKGEQPEKMPIAKDLGLIGAGMAGLLLGGHWLVEGSVAIAKIVGVSDTVIGLTIVAVGTSAPEIVAAAVAAKRGHPDIAVGNAIGSCVFNLLNVLGLAAMVHPLTANGIGVLDMGFMVGLAILVLPLMRTGSIIQRSEGVICLIAYVSYIALMWPK